MSSYLPTVSFLFILSTSLSAAPISATLTDQTDSVSTFTLAGGQLCHDAGQFSSTCSSQSGGAVASASASIDTSLLFAAASTSGGANRGQGTASFTSTIMISGGEGEGYVNLAYLLAGSGSTNNTVAVIVNGAEIDRNNYGSMPIWTVLPFTFGDPLTYSVTLSAQADGGYFYGGSNSLLLTGARVYSSQPTCDPGQFDQHGYGLCADPGYYDATAVFADPPVSTAAETPEPATLLTTVPALLALALTRRRYSRRQARQS